jgi:hypothetical protein
MRDPRPSLIELSEKIEYLSLIKLIGSDSNPEGPKLSESLEKKLTNSSSIGLVTICIN